MLSKVEVYNPRGTMLSLPLQDVSEGFIIQNIDGLDPVKATITSSSFAQLDGEQFQSSRREKRNIVMRLGLEPDYSTQTVGGLRNRLYDFFLPKAEVRLAFYRDGVPPVYIDGTVESMTTALFSKDPAVDISILCFNPDFEELGVVDTEGQPAANEGNPEIWFPIEYTGTSPTGVLFHIGGLRPAMGFTIDNDRDDGNPAQHFEVNAAFTLNEGIDVTSFPGNKTATLSNVFTLASKSVLYAVEPKSIWLTLVPGMNNISVVVLGGPFNTLYWSIQYTRKFGGL